VLNTNKIIELKLLNKIIDARCLLIGIERKHDQANLCVGFAFTVGNKNGHLRARGFAPRPLTQQQ
jgi:hypothetical protein